MFGNLLRKKSASKILKSNKADVVLRLMFEIAISDGSLDKAELEMIKERANKSSNKDETVSKIIKRIIDETEDSVSFYPSVKKINEAYSLEEKKELLAVLWNLVTADSVVDAYEENLYFSKKGSIDNNLKVKWSVSESEYKIVENAEYVEEAYNLVGCKNCKTIWNPGKIIDQFFEEDILEFFEKEGNSFFDMIEHDYLNRTFEPYDQAFYMNLLKRHGSKYHRLTVKEIDKSEAEKILKEENEKNLKAQSTADVTKKKPRTSEKKPKKAPIKKKAKKVSKK